MLIENDLFFYKTFKKSFDDKRTRSSHKMLYEVLVGKKMGQIQCSVNWKTVMEMANRQEVNAIAFDGYQTIHDTIAKECKYPKLWLSEF